MTTEEYSLGVTGVSRGESAPRGESPCAENPINRPLKQQYRECYRLWRLIQQSLAMADYVSLIELTEEKSAYPPHIQASACHTWAEFLGAWRKDHKHIDVDVLRAWRHQYAEKMRSQ